MIPISSTKKAVLCTLAWVCSALLLLAAHTPEEIRATFSPTSIYLDQSATYTLNINGVNRLGEIHLPQVDGLIFVSQSKSTNMAFGFGRNSHFSTRLTFVIKARRAGKFTIPSFQIKTREGILNVPEAQLEVLPLSTVRQQQIVKDQRIKQEAQSELIGLELSFQEKPLYVGQAVPMHLIAYARADLFAVPSQLPKKIGDEFTLAAFNKTPVEKSTYRKGRRYQQIIWENVLTPVKAGHFNLQFTENYIIGHSIFNQGQIELASTPLKLAVQPLPSAGKPEDFSGAIGQFNLSEPIFSSTVAQLGKPLTMTLELKGKGNFSRITAPSLKGNENWNIYPPEESFENKDPYGYYGSKIFKYILIPKNSGKQKAPEFNFTYFDPQSAKYITLKNQPTVLMVKPSLQGDQEKTNNTSKIASTEQSKPILLPITQTYGEWKPKHFKPLFLKISFLLSQLIPLVALLSFVIYRSKILRLRNDISYARTHRAEKQVKLFLKKAKQAIENKQSRAFYEAALRSIQEAVGPHFPGEPNAITLTELKNHLETNNFPPKDLEIIRTYFVSSDALRFSGVSESTVDFQGKYQTLKRLLDLLLTEL